MNIDEDNRLTGIVIGAAIAVHRELGPGNEEAACEEALSAKLTKLGVPHECQKQLPLEYKGVTLDCGYRLDLLIDNRVPVELKAVETVLSIHEAQLLTYMSLGNHPLGLLVNFEVAALKDGIQRKIITKPRCTESTTWPAPGYGDEELSTNIIRAFMEVRRHLGPGLLRSAYEECLCHELGLRNIEYKRKTKIPLCFEGKKLAHEAMIPLFVSDEVPVICLSVSKLTRLHECQLLARLRQTGCSYGFLVNFNASNPAQGIKRINLKNLIVQ